MCSAQRLTQSLGGLSGGDRAELGGQAEGVEAEGEQHRVAARAAEARVGVADRVAANVADVDVARGERGGGLDVAVRLLLERRRRPEGVTLAPRRLAARLDGLGLGNWCAFPRSCQPSISKGLWSCVTIAMLRFTWLSC